METFPFTLLSQEQLIISDAEKTITASKLADANDVPLDVRGAIFTHLTGGDIYHVEKFGARSQYSSGGTTLSLDAVPALSQAGANGEHHETAGNQWAIKGREAILVWTAVKASGHG